MPVKNFILLQPPQNYILFHCPLDGERFNAPVCFYYGITEYNPNSCGILFMFLTQNTFLNRLHL